MKLMTKKDFGNLKYWDKVYSTIKNQFWVWYNFVWLMPSCKRYWIFSCWEQLIHQHISDSVKDNEIIFWWYKWEYDSEFMGLKRIIQAKSNFDSAIRFYKNKHWETAELKDILNSN